MSDVGRYRKLYPRIWRHAGFQRLTPSQQALTLYLLTGPQSNRIGLFYFSTATAAEDLNVSPETFRKALAEVQATFNWHFDRDSRVFFIPTWWRWNHPDHAKVLQGNLKDLNEVPPCELVEEFARNLAYLTPELHEAFAEACRIRIPKATPSQDQYQESGSGKREQGAVRGRAPRAAASGNAEILVSIAREALQHTNHDADMDLRIDTFQCLAREKTRFKVSRAQAIDAINIALSERRQH